MSISTAGHNCKESKMPIGKKKGLLALSPLIVFVLLYFATSLIAHDFYKMPISVAFMLSSIYAIAISPGKALSEKVNAFCVGAGKPNIMLMVWIFILAGAFSYSAKAIGSIEATVNQMLHILPENMMMAGLFIATCFISFSIGTSVGTIVALVPIAAGLAATTATSVPLMVAVVVGGAFFGDNLSFISDTTIAATSSQGCKMSDKFKANSFLVFPAAIVVLAAYIFMGSSTGTPAATPSVNIVKVIPYIAVLATAVCGMNVIVVLASGIILTGIIGVADGSYDVYGWFKAMGDGILGMGELIVITLLAGGLFEIVRKNGGIEYLINKVSGKIHGKRGAEFVISLLVSLVDVCTANNTVAIITVGGMAKHISTKFGVDSRKAASILDTFSCCMQGIIPYGAQLLMAAGLSGLNPLDIMPFLYYPYVLGLFALLSILFRFPKRYS